MPAPFTPQAWQNYCARELAALKPLVHKLGFALKTEQIHLGGERYLSSSHKLVLLGECLGDRKKVVLKVSRDPAGQAEIRRERKCRLILDKINFAYQAFLSPAEIFFGYSGPYLLLLTEFLEQSSTFLTRPLDEQFFLSLRGLEAQESAHASTYEHTRLISRTFGRWQAPQYLEAATTYRQESAARLDNKDRELLDKTYRFLEKNQDTINLYSDFLVHWDFVPHNIRVVGEDIYLLDHSSLRFGNKYESWARWLNFMTLHNRPLEKMLLDYLRQNRSTSEYLSLLLMRLFRLTELIHHYTRLIPLSHENLLLLNKKRLGFWTSVLKNVLQDKPVSDEIVRRYQAERDDLRGTEEKLRQKELH